MQDVDRDGGSEPSSFSSNEVSVVYSLSNTSLTINFRDEQLLFEKFN